MLAFAGKQGYDFRVDRSATQFEWVCVVVNFAKQLYSATKSEKSEGAGIRQASSCMACVLDVGT